MRICGGERFMTKIGRPLSLSASYLAARLPLFTHGPNSLVFNGYSLQKYPYARPSAKDYLVFSLLRANLTYVYKRFAIENA